jgi:hypothetical protein
MAVTAEDPKVAVLAASRSLNPHPEKVTDEVFLASPFCDARDVVQVKYEMVRRVRVDKVPVVRAARAFGYCRQAFYEIAAALDAGGPSALVPGKPGPKGPVKLTVPVMERIDAWLAADDGLTSKGIAERVAEEFGFTVPPGPSSVHCRGGASRKVPVRRSPYPTAVFPGGDAAAGVTEYERLRESAGRGGGRHGLGVLVACGMVAFLKVAASLAAAAAPRSPVPPSAGTAVTALDAEVIRVWSRMVLAHVNSP